MAEAGLALLKQSRDIIVEWKAYELRPEGKFQGPPELEAKYHQRILESHGQMVAYAKEHFGLEMMAEPRIGVNSRPAMEGAFYAREKGKEEAYHHLCLEAHWQQGKRLDDIDILVAIAEAAGLDGAEFRQIVESHKYRVEFEMDLMLGREYGIQGVPAFIFANRYLVSGARPVAALEYVVDKCIEEGLVE